MDQGVEPTKAGNGEFHDPTTRCGVFQVVAECGGIPAIRRDFRDNGFGDRRVETAPILGDTGIVDDDSPASRGDQPRIARTKPRPAPVTITV